MAIILAFIVALIVHGIWYFYLGSLWREYNLLNERILSEKVSVAPFLYTILSYLVVFNLMAWIFTKIPVSNAFQGMGLGGLFACGFYVSVLFGQNEFALRPIETAFIDGGVIVVSWMIGGLILGAWKKYDLIEPDESQSNLPEPTMNL